MSRLPAAFTQRVALPRLDLHDAVALATEIEAQARRRPPTLASAPARTSAPRGRRRSNEPAAPALPELLARPLARLVAARDAARTALQAHAPSAAPATPTAREADAVIDTAWRAFEAWLHGWTLLAGAHQADAQGLYDAVFGAEGLRFISVDFESEWAESAKRLGLLSEPRSMAVLGALGAAPFLAELRQAQAAYGAALGITVPAPPPSGAITAGLRAEYTALLEALREYAAKVGATVDRELPATAARAAWLLRPLAAWTREADGATASATTTATSTR